MKILIHSEGAGAHHYQRLGLAKAFAYAGHEVGVWNKQIKPAFDMFDEFQPDIFLGQTYNLDRATVKCLKTAPDLSVGLRASDNSSFSRSVKDKGFNILLATDAEESLVEQVGPDFLHSYYEQKWIDQIHERWTELGYTCYSSMLAADVFEYTNGEFRPEYECDIAFVGGYWAYKGQNIDRYLVPLCQDKYDYKIKIFGNQGWYVPQYCGWIADDQVKHLTASARVCPNISEPHATEFGYDVNERIFKLLANKCVVVSDYVESAQEVFQGCAIFAKTPEEFKTHIDMCIDFPEEVQDMVETGYDVVINNHTYFHRAKEMFANFGLVEEIDRMDQAYEKAREELKL